MPPPPEETVSAYPSGPYGGSRGETLEDHRFTLSDGTTISFADIRMNPDVKAVLWVQSAEWCGACRQQVPHLNELHQRYGGSGGALFVIESLFEDNNGSPADAATAGRWEQHGTDFTVVADRSPAVRAYVTPSAWVIDAETMQVLEVFEGDQNSIDSAVERAISTSTR
jgi:thiol-disulfide isomerase/thioredoxin